MNGVGAFRAGVGKGSKQFLFSLIDLRVVDRGSRRAFGILGGCEACAAPKQQKVGEGIAAEAIRTMKPGCRFTGSEKTRHGRLRSFRVHSDAAHHVMAGGTNFHGTLGNVDVREFLELVIHARKFLLHVLSGFVGNIEIRATVFSAAALLDFRIDGAGNDGARGKFHASGMVLFHEALACLVAQDAAFSANCFGHENALYTGRPDHSGGMELNEFHVHELGAGLIGKGHAVAGVFPGVGSDAPGFANAARCDDDSSRLENDEAAVLAPVRKRTGNAAVFRQEPCDGAFHVDVNTLLNAAILQSANHFEAGAVADMAEAVESMAAEGALQDVAAFGAVEESAPLFEFTNTIKRFLGM